MLLRLGTRGSALARWQTDHVRDLLHTAWPDLQTEVQVFTTHGDQTLDKPLPSVGGKGVFTAELEAALRADQIDLAVHSLKDLPTEPSDKLIIGAVPRRADPHDVLIARNAVGLGSLPKGAVIGSSSTRRRAQLLHWRPDCSVIDIRGNVDTRLRKALDEQGAYDAIILARAGLERLGLLDAITETMPFERMLPAPAQGALGVQCRDEEAIRARLAPLTDPATFTAVTAERAFLAGLGGGCALPIAAYAALDGERLTLIGRVCAPDGSAQIEVKGSHEYGASVEAARQLGIALADQAHNQGADRLLR